MQYVLIMTSLLLLCASGCSNTPEKPPPPSVTAHVEVYCPPPTPFSELTFADPEFYVLLPLDMINPNIDYTQESFKHLEAVRDESLWATTPEGYGALANMVDDFRRIQKETYSNIKSVMSCIDKFNARARVAKDETAAMLTLPKEPEKRWWQVWR